MDASPIIWRVNRHPRFTVLEMGEYMAADDGPRETMLRDMRYERMARSLTYSTVRRAVGNFLASPTRDRRILVGCRVDLEAEIASAQNAQRRENLIHELRALEAFERSLNSLELAGLNLSRAPVGDPLLIEGVRVSVQPNALVRIVRPRGGELAGALVIDLAKGTTPKTDESVERVKRSMEYAAALILQHVSGWAGDAKPSPDHCVVFHIHRQERVCAPSATKKMLRNVEAVCRNISRGWHNIAAPTNFDETRARVRG